MAVNKERIVMGDTFAVAYRCVKRDPNPQNRNKLAVPPETAVVMLWSVADQVYYPLGPTPEQIEGIADIDGNIVSFLIEPEMFPTEGDYKIFTQAEFEDGQKVTAVQPVKVMLRS